MTNLQSYFINQHIYNHISWWQEVLGEPVEIDTGITDFNIFVFKNKYNYWYAADALTGGNAAFLYKRYLDKEEIIQDVKYRLEKAIKDGTLQKTVDEAISYLQKIGLLDEHNNKIGKKVMIKR